MSQTLLTKPETEGDRCEEQWMRWWNLECILLVHGFISRWCGSWYSNLADVGTTCQPAQLQELGDLQEPSNAERISRHEYRGWAPGASDDEEQSRQSHRDTHSSAALMNEHVNTREEQHASHDMRIRRLRDETQLEWRDLLSVSPDDSIPQESPPRTQPYFDANEASTVIESSLRTTALLQAVRRNPTFSARSRNEQQRYLLDRERERIEDRSRTTSARINEPIHSNASPSQRRQMHREASVRQELQQQRDLVTEHQQRRNYLEEQLRQQRDGLAPTSDSRRRRYGQQRPDYWPIYTSRRRLDDVIKYLGQLRLCESDNEGQTTAEEVGLNTEELFPRDRQDFLVNVQAVSPPPESSWLRIGGVLFGTQHGSNFPAALPNYTPLMPPSVYRSRNGDQHFGSVPPRAASPTSQVPEGSAMYEEERWPVKVTIDSIDYTTMTLAGTMEAFNVPDKHSPTKMSSITTFLEGEIIDFNHFTLETKSFKADARVDGMYWKKLPPFKELGDDDTMAKNLLSKEWLEKEVMQKYVLMRWKGLFKNSLHSPYECIVKLTATPEKCFVTKTEAQTALTISGFYYVSLRRENGRVEGLYYDPHSNPYQYLSMYPQKKSFPTYTFA